jgi:BatD DUF11 like domain
MFRRIMGCWLLALLLVPVLGRAAVVQATLDRSTVQLGQTVTLNLRISGDAVNLGAPDFDALNKDFEVLNISPNFDLGVANGAAMPELVLGVALRPRHEGVLQIPALNLAGGQTTPLQLQVNAPDPGTATVAHKDVFMEAQIEPGHGYVGQQLSYVVRLYFAPNISIESLDAPQLNGGEVGRIGDDLNYDAEREGRQYHVLERRYALIPQHAGHLEIPPLRSQGESIDPNDPNSFFGASTPVSASAPAVTAEVQAAPADWGKTAWLPARQLSLTLDGWPGAQDQLRVGQPLNLTMNLQTTGLPFEALPELSLPPLDGATVYPDKPVTGTRNDGQWIAGWRQQAFAIVPERVGTLAIPATTLKWWNVLTDRMEIAQIPAHSVTVLPAIGGVAATHPANPAVVSTTLATAAPTSAGSTATHATPWRWIALGSIGLWLFSVLAWLLWRRRQRRSPPIVTPVPTQPSARQVQQAFLDAARGSDTAAQVHSLLAWARSERPTIQHLGELAQALDDGQQRAAIADLQQRHYAGTPVPAVGVKLADVFKRGFVWRPADARDDDADLPPLYPFKLH